MTARFNAFATAVLSIGFARGKAGRIGKCRIGKCRIAKCKRGWAVRTGLEAAKQRGSSYRRFSHRKRFGWGDGACSPGFVKTASRPIDECEIRKFG